MICNIQDHRKMPHRWKRVHAIVESTYLDNSVVNSDFAPMTDSGPLYADSDGEDISLNEAILWANSFEEPVTLYLYDV
jgi:hypothetical protein